MSQNNLQMGNYRLLRLIGKGGFADVYLARHIYLNNLAAIKVLHIDQDYLEMFHKEAQTIAELTHPNIVRVFDFGLEDDRAFLVMEYAPYGSLGRYGNSVVPLPNVLSYVRQVAGALQYSHNRQVIHRDIKPENMLIAANYHILLSDFGLALHNRTLSIEHAETAGTVSYVAPEQIQGFPQPASDQYSLAITVYKWLCGKLPFQGTIAEVTAQQLSALPPPLHGPLEIERVVMRALAKDPKARFSDVQEFADALVEAGEAIGVEPSRPEEEHFSTSGAKRRAAPETVKLSSRRISRQSGRELASAATIRQNKPDKPVMPPSPRPGHLSRRQIMLGIITIAGAGALGLGIAALQHAPAAPVLRQFPSPTTLPTLASTPTKGSTPMSTKKPAPSSTPNPSPTPVQQQAPAQTPTSAPSNPGLLFYTYTGHSNVVYAVTWSPDGKYVASGGADQTAQVWSATNGFPILIYRGHSATVTALAWSPNGTRIASASDDHTVHVWNQNGNLLYICRGHTNSVHTVAWSPDGTKLATGSSDNTARIWDTSGNLLMSYTDHHATVWSVTWSPSGRYLASASGSVGSPDHTVKIWDINTGSTTFTYNGHNDLVFYAVWSPDGKHIASGGNGGSLQLWSAISGNQELIYRGHTDTVYGLSWSPDSTRLASGSLDNTVKIWDIQNNSTVFSYNGHSAAVYGVAWSPDGTRIASGSYDRTVQVWQA
ncbi:hypothetical protein EPA93_43300 [Ktedonosporobacter rubrisoli]|uniref:Uncharacterized protein n=1 Tax=Ktedonosporobacter rubrisoli TaxID=2509675 RepID=A0A4P6K3F6_KTERU|nr:serine/threonine-protein kinase [Ktedonosporobacter rubrisoli]QBD82443.1 hypothetical protein EPA93_43300 [Ktedonosporobacter rubrisoli]